ncbi:MAG TPA: septal ring lytic transglycosylase RlpA family protein [Aliidongia sp.]|uniref:septal ring lytic transglycosylase RlpA family protein n=1 Tax=Aliidongia sp. TaxID=1914230 RepID=UPI002DDD2B28|nr:septal ring lytic transglycosylase RlpA family protein [Aliidongia sp.]HEV2678006.1 septal ring lytic transglycosylase RlpA family protein [Aliidongia sp.]
MMSRRRPVPLAACLVLSLALAACASKPAAVQTSSAEKSQGTFKIGKPYPVNGVWYYPSADLNYDETGIASWYGPDFHEKATANGEQFDQNALSAAHKTLPLPSIVQVTNLENGRSIEVRVNDRGPFVGNRIIDLSRRSAQLLGFEGQGTAKVRVKVLSSESIQAQSIARLNGSDTAPIEVPQAAPHQTVVAEALPPAVGVPLAPPQAAQAAAAPATPPAARPASLQEPELPNMVLLYPVKPTHIYVQAGAFSLGDNATRMKARLSGLGDVSVTGARVNGIDVYRVRLGPIGSVDEADQVLARAVGAGATEAKIVVD